MESTVKGTRRRSSIEEINLADAALLEILQDIGPAIAQRIIEYQEMNGLLETIEQLLDVQGIGPATLETS